METIKQKEKNVFNATKTRFGYGNSMAAPRLVKVVISSGVGSSRKDKNRKEIVADRLGKITGQKAVSVGAKKSIASFKLREGEIVGYKITLRGSRMYDFLDRFLNIAVPRMRDFRGFDRNGVDAAGNLTVGIKEHNIFPETAVEDIKDIFGLAVTIVSSANNKEEATAFFDALGIPFKKLNRGVK